MAQIGLPVPPAFVIGTRFCEMIENYEAFNDLVHDNIMKLQQTTGLIFGGTRKPLLVAARSMPGMLSSILNRGICNETLGDPLRMTGGWKRYASKCHVKSD